MSSENRKGDFGVIRGMKGSGYSDGVGFKLVLLVIDVNNI